MASIIRPFREDDAEPLAALTGAAIRSIGGRAYAPGQVAAWAARHPGPQRFIASAAKGDIILVTVNAADLPTAYALLEPDGHVDMLYCHPDYAGTGLAGRLLDSAEDRARAAGIARLFTEASELARPVFARAGFRLVQRRDFTIPHAGEDVAIHNYAMEKVLD
ncbi:GNAT family N-acetyltransferase [Erythrobacter sp.]|uniref:GNAT family N-acetyltransferase n=1 Tax=Erythrobacter sp. TaxID=1042 RepID=UPI0025CF360F|nr:GNAT family N-acetyltransferase [Erythrobacter sp.]